MGDAVRLVLGTAELDDAANTERLLHEFYDAGGRAIDLANVYGDGAHSRWVGRWLRADHGRDDVVLYVKGCHPPRCDPALVRREVEQALANLGRERLDVFLVHRDDPDIPIESWAAAFAEELSRGRVDTVGVSNWTLSRFEDLRARLSAAGEHRLTAFSNHFSLAQMVEPPWPGCRSVDARTARLLTGSGITVLAWASLAQGFLAGSGSRTITRCWETETNRIRRSRATELAERRGTTTAAIAIAYVLWHGIRPVVGARSSEHLTGALAAELVELGPDDIVHLEARAA